MLIGALPRTMYTPVLTTHLFFVRSCGHHQVADSLARTASLSLTIFQGPAVPSGAGCCALGSRVLCPREQGHSLISCFRCWQGESVVTLSKSTSVCLSPRPKQRRYTNFVLRDCCRPTVHGWHKVPLRDDGWLEIPPGVSQAEKGVHSTAGVRSSYVVPATTVVVRSHRVNNEKD